MTAIDDHPNDHLATLIGERVTSAQIANLTAWMRRLTDAGPAHADPGELAAFSRAKQDLLARIQRRTQTPNTTVDQAADQAGDPRD